MSLYGCSTLTISIMLVLYLKRIQRWTSEPDRLYCPRSKLGSGHMEKRALVVLRMLPSTVHGLANYKLPSGSCSLTYWEHWQRKTCMWK